MLKNENMLLQFVYLWLWCTCGIVFVGVYLYLLHSRSRDFITFFNRDDMQGITFLLKCNESKRRVIVPRVLAVKI